MTKPNWSRDRNTGSNSMEPPARSQMSLRSRTAVHAQNRDLGGVDLHRPRKHREPVSHGDPLRTIRVVGNDAPAHSAADLLAEKLFPRGRIERIEVAAHITEEHDPSGGGCDTGDDGIIGLRAPLPDPGIGIDGI